MCSDWDTDLEEPDQKNLEVQKQRNIENKTPQPSPKPFPDDTVTHQPSQPSIDWFGNQISLSSEDTLENID